MGSVKKVLTLSVIMIYDLEDPSWCCDQWVDEQNQGIHYDQVHKERLVQCPACSFNSKELDEVDQHFMDKHSEDDIEDVDIADPFEIDNIFESAASIDFSEGVTRAELPGNVPNIIGSNEVSKQ